ncbi:hypothetical protein C161_27258 [Paenibacillus sp. FSL R5-192]|uniref:hypothetical protein n=1 Tax=Paenibacillus sp. FSL R5-192 TaxID=1226754 RepID=UPI0003E2605C|nr:hypothetical protein [Paenibacillus sp. FSL R5-192]ETT30674.1 hypothetical protein C161_27258 [Paenibacillus sp. FSL R5-192]
MVNLKSIIDEELRKRFSEAKVAGNEYLDVISGDIHKQLGFKHRMPSCCHAMREMMKTGDIIIEAPLKGDGATLKIRYFL